METRPTPVLKAKQVGEVPARWAWTEPAVWTERMLTALEEGVKGGIWFSLIDKVYKPRNLRAAFAKVKANQGAAGIDAETIERFENKLGDNLYKLWNRMSAGSYFPSPVKAVPIPKKSGGVRMLGVPTVADRIGQTAAKMWLEPRLDPIFHEDSYGYRPGKSALTAIAVTRRRCWDSDWVVEFDIRIPLHTTPTVMSLC